MTKNGKGRNGNGGTLPNNRRRRRNRRRRDRIGSRRFGFALVLIIILVTIAILVAGVFAGASAALSNCNLASLKPVSIGQNSFVYAADGSLLGAIPAERNSWFRSASRPVPSSMPLTFSSSARTPTAISVAMPGAWLNTADQSAEPNALAAHGDGAKGIWVTEFGWDTAPADPKGVPLALHARWVSEALYRMWNAGVSLVTWIQLRDDPLTTSYTQSGLYLRAREVQRDRPKAALRAFRFPFVAFPDSSSRAT